MTRKLGIGFRPREGLPVSGRKRHEISPRTGEMEVRETPFFVIIGGGFPSHRSRIVYRSQYSARSRGRRRKRAVSRLATFRRIALLILS